jgi:hypothetical protein
MPPNPSFPMRKIHSLTATSGRKAPGFDHMPQQILLRDRLNGQPATHSVVMDWQDGVPLTPRTLIMERVRNEWEAQKAEREVNASGQLKPLVDRAMMERMNPFRFKSQGEAPVTLGSVTAMALEGFTRNSFFLLIDGQQITDLDQVITLKPTSDVTFVRLMPLKGG